MRKNEISQKQNYYASTIGDQQNKREKNLEKKKSYEDGNFYGNFFYQPSNNGMMCREEERQLFCEGS